MKSTLKIFAALAIVALAFAPAAMAETTNHQDISVTGNIPTYLDIQVDTNTAALGDLTASSPSATVNVTVTANVDWVVTATSQHNGAMFHQGAFDYVNYALLKNGADTVELDIPDAPVANGTATGESGTQFSLLFLASSGLYNHLQGNYSDTLTVTIAAAL